MLGNKSLRTIARAAACAFMVAGAAQAAVVTVDADAAASGADISSFFAGGPHGVALSAAGSGNTDGKVYALETIAPGASCCSPPTGTQAFARFDGNGSTAYWLNVGMVATLDGWLAALVSIDASTDGTLWLEAYDAADGLIGSASQRGNGPLTVSVGAGGNAIAKVRIGISNPSDFAMLDHLVFTTADATVPEPGTAALALAALLGVVSARRRVNNRA